MSTLALNNAEAVLLRSALPHLSDQELAEAMDLVMGPETVLEQLRRDPANLFALTGRAPDPWQTALLRGESKRMLLLCSRQSGKSTTAAALALREALLYPGSLVLLLSPTQRQSGELHRDKVRRLYNELGRPVPTTQESQLQMELANGSRVISLPGDEETVRGYSGVRLLVIDEASRVNDDLYKSVRPMLAVSKGGLVALSTPFGKRGWFHSEWHGDNAWDRVRITASECPRIDAAFLEEERRALGDDWYAQEYECAFTEGGAFPLFPPAWLDRAERVADELRGMRKREAAAMGVDPAEGGDRTAWAVVDEYGVMHLQAIKTPDTNVVVNETIDLIRRYGLRPEKVVFDAGGGGYVHACALKARGFPVRTVGFGESVTLDLKRGLTSIEERMGNREERYAYEDRRAQMYGELRTLLDPANERGFGIPREYRALREQLGPIPKLWDGEGRLRLPPKNRRHAGSVEQTLVDLIGHSPDEADALVLAVHGMRHRGARMKAGAV